MISLNMVLEQLPPDSIVAAPSRKTPRFKRIVFLPDGSALPTCSDDTNGSNAALPPLSANTLYCGSLETVRTRIDQLSREGCFALAVRNEREEDGGFSQSNASPGTTNNLGDRAVVCSCDNTPHELYLKLEEYFASIESWVSKMRLALLDGGGYQSLVNCSEPVLQNFLMVSNSEFRPLAYSLHTPIDDPMTLDIIEQGGHPKTAIDLFKKYHVTRDWQAQTKIELKPASELNTHPVLDYIFRVHGNYFIHVLMHCNIKEPTPGLKDAFQLLIDHLDLYVRRDWNEQQLLGQEPSRLFSDLITKSPFSSKALDNRLRGLNVPKEAPFTLYAFLFATESADNQLLLFYLRKLKEAFPQCHVGVYGSHVLALDAEGGLEPNGPQMQALASAYPCVIGMSAPFGHLGEFVFAYRQAKSAIELAVNARQSLASSYLDNHTALVRQFDCNFVSYVANVAKNNNQLVTHFVEQGTVARILNFDEQHGTDDARILFFFLANERKVSAACEALFMHRNTLLYRIGKIQERFSFNLNDFPTRQRLLMEYFLLPAPTATSEKQTSRSNGERNRIQASRS